MAPGATNMRLADLYALLRRDFGVEVVQMNHPRHEGVGESGYLNALGPEGQPYDPGKPITAPPNAHLLTPGADGHTRAIECVASSMGSHRAEPRSLLSPRPPSTPATG